MSYFIRIREWARYQHYKDRNPPWIKLYREMISSRTWVECDDASRVLAIASMMLAAATENKIPASKSYIRRVAYLNQDPDYTKLIETQFVEIIDDRGKIVKDASVLLAERKQVVQNAIPETETETEKRHKNIPSRSRSMEKEIFAKAYESYPRHVGKRAAEKAWSAAVGRGHPEDMLYQNSMTFGAVCIRIHKPKEFIPHMATWLNQDRFLDDPSEWAVLGNGGNGNGKPNGQAKHDQQIDAIRRAAERVHNRSDGENKKPLPH